MDTKNYGVRDMFNFWVRNQRKEKPYLEVKYPARNKNTELWYKVRQELEYLNIKLLNLDKEIQKLEIRDHDISRFTATTRKIYELKHEMYQTREKIKELEKDSPDKALKLLDFYTFRDVIYSYNRKAADQLIQEGSVLNFNEKLGYLYILKINRFNSKINWGESNDRKAELIAAGETPKDKNNPDGVNWLVYYSSRYYLRWAWRKKYHACKVKNQTVYEFIPTQSSTKGVPGTKQLLSDANNTNPLLHLKYISR